jgi:aldose 1-epimerase
MADRRNYTARRLAVDSIEVVRLADLAHGVELSITPSIGNIAYDLRVHGQPVLSSPPGNLAEWKANPSMAGIPLLAPWANRIEPDWYWANEKKFLLNGELGNLRRDHNGLAIHGLLLFTSEWRVVRLNADESGAEVTSRLDFWKRPEWMAQFPFAHTIEMTHRLCDGGTEVRTAIENHSSEAMPVSLGLHPWFQIPDCPRDSWNMHLPVRDQYELSKKMVPNGEIDPVDFPDGVPLAGKEFDDVYGGVNSRDEFWVEGGGRRISVRFGPKFPIACLYAPQGKNAVCFEPMTAITNALNLAHSGLYQQLQSIPHGGAWSESFWISTNGF